MMGRGPVEPPQACGRTSGGSLVEDILGRGGTSGCAAQRPRLLPRSLPPLLPEARGLVQLCRHQQHGGWRPLQRCVRRGRVCTSDKSAKIVEKGGRHPPRSAARAGREGGGVQSPGVIDQEWPRPTSRVSGEAALWREGTADDRVQGRSFLGTTSFLTVNGGGEGREGGVPAKRETAAVTRRIGWAEARRRSVSSPMRRQGGYG